MVVIQAFFPRIELDKIGNENQREGNVGEGGGGPEEWSWGESPGPGYSAVFVSVVFCLWWSHATNRKGTFYVCASVCMWVQLYVNQFTLPNMVETQEVTACGRLYPSLLLLLLLLFG